MVSDKIESSINALIGIATTGAPELRSAMIPIINELVDAQDLARSMESNLLVSEEAEYGKA